MNVVFVRRNFHDGVQKQPIEDSIPSSYSRSILGQDTEPQIAHNGCGCVDSLIDVQVALCVCSVKAL